MFAHLQKNLRDMDSSGLAYKIKSSCDRFVEGCFAGCGNPVTCIPLSLERGWTTRPCIHSICNISSGFHDKNQAEDYWGVILIMYIGRYPTTSPMHTHLHKDMCNMESTCLARRIAIAAADIHETPCIFKMIRNPHDFGVRRTSFEITGTLNGSCEIVFCVYQLLCFTSQSALHCLLYCVLFKFFLCFYV